MRSSPLARRSQPAQHGETFDWSANLIAQRFRAPEGGYIPNPYGRDLGLGYRVRTPSSQEGDRGVEIINKEITL